MIQGGSGWFPLFIVSLAFMSGSDIDYSGYDRLTKTYVDSTGLVNYRGLKGDLKQLRSFVDQISEIGPDNRPDLFNNQQDRLRYYITAYNAWVLYIAASEYPSKKSLWFLGVFRNRKIKLAGRDLTLNDLEHEIIRKRFKDPRIHFYINCAAVSCPPLSRGAIPEGNTDVSLEEAARRFINDERHVKFDINKKRLMLSKIFDWFEEDFLDYLRNERGEEDPHISQYLSLYLSSPAGEALRNTPSGELEIKHFKYDKSLNEQKR